MIVVPHQAIGMADPTKPIDDIAKSLEERTAVLIVFVDRLLAVSSGGDVIHRSGELDPQRPGHGDDLAENLL
jgi:hypothetical protein